MKRCILLIRVLFFLTPLIANAQGTVVADSFYSNSLGFIRHMNVYLPEGYDTTTIDYPVIYFLHGATVDHNAYTPIHGKLDSLIGNQIIEPVIFVSPDGSVNPYCGSWYTNSELYGAFEDYIAYDLVEYIDLTYRTISDRNKRCIMGHSMGGYGCMKLALKHPDVYRAAASHSGAFEHNVFFADWIPIVLSENGSSPPYNYTYNAGLFTNLTFTIAGAYSPDTTNPPYFVDFPLDSMGNIIDSVLARWEPHSLPRLAAQLPPDTNLALYFDCGEQDELYFYPANMAFADSLDSLGIPYEFQSFPGGHSNLVFFRVLISLAFLDSVINTGIEEHEASQTVATMLQVGPNPFCDRMNISLSMGNKSEEIVLIIYDATGRMIKDLSQSKVLSWNGTDDSNRRLPSGVYFLKLTAGVYTTTEKLLLIR